MKKYAITLTLAIIGLFAGAESASAQDLTCTGTIGAVSADTVFVPPGASCVLIGTQIRGDIKVGQSANLDARTVRLDGSVQAEFANRVLVRANSFIRGSIQLKGGNTATITRTRVLGDVQLEENRGSLTVSFSNITGELLAAKNFGAIQFLSNASVGVDIKAEENTQQVRIDGNNSSGDIQLSKNSGGVTVTNNFASGNLQCVENRPFQIQSGNTVGGNLECPNF